MKVPINQEVHRLPAIGSNFVRDPSKMLEIRKMLGGTKLHEQLKNIELLHKW